MPFLHPGCGYPTQFAAKIIAVCDLIFGFVGMFWFVYILEGYGILMEDPSIFNPNNRLTSTPAPAILISTDDFASNMNASNANDPFLSLSDEGIQINGRSSKIFLSGFYTIVNLCAFVLLLSGAHQKSIPKLKLWFVIRLTVFIFKIVLYSIYICIGAAIYSQTPHIIFMIVHLYGLWVVYVFIKEIRAEQEEAALRSSTGQQDGTVGYINFSNTAENKA